MDVRVGLWRKLSAEELMLLNRGVGEDSWESLGLQGDPTSHSKGDQSWVFFGRNDAKAETPVLWPPHMNCWFIGKDSDAGRDWGQEEKWKTEDEAAGWHHGLDGCEFECPLGVGDGQGGLTCCNSRGHKCWAWLSDWTELIIHSFLGKIEALYSCFDVKKLLIIYYTSIKQCASSIIGDHILFSFTFPLDSCMSDFFTFFLSPLNLMLLERHFLLIVGIKKHNPYHNHQSFSAEPISLYFLYKGNRT